VKSVDNRLQILSDKGAESFDGSAPVLPCKTEQRIELPMKSQNHRFLAAALSIFLPVAGQCYKGQKHKAILGYSFFFLYR
jgi:hypothetical protein